ncbi:MAG: chemotaxis protein CheX [bacterium]
MKAEYINPFVKTAVSTLKQFIPDIEIERGELSVSESPFETVGTATYIGISGDLEGRVIYEMDRPTAVNIASAMNGEDLPGLNEMVRSTIQELGNIISGNATTELRQAADNKEIEITPPSMIVGRDTEISDSVSSKFLSVPLKTNHGDVIVNVAVQD